MLYICDKVIRLYNVWRLLGTIIRIRLLEIKRWPLNNLLCPVEVILFGFRFSLKKGCMDFHQMSLSFLYVRGKAIGYLKLSYVFLKLRVSVGRSKCYGVGFRMVLFSFYRKRALHPSWLGEPKLGWNYSKDLLIKPIIIIILSIINYPSFSRMRWIGSQLHHLWMKAEIKYFNLCGYFF